LRDLLAHRYFDTSHSILQATVDHDLPALNAAILRLLNSSQRIQLPCLLGGHISIAGHPMETIIAEKSVTILQRGTTSTRWRDFVDIRHLARTYPSLAGPVTTSSRMASMAGHPE